MGRNSPQPKPSPLQSVPKSQSYIYLSLPPHLFLSFSLSISFAQIQPGDISCISSPPAHIARVHSVSAVACAESNYIFAVIEMPGKRRRPPPSDVVLVWRIDESIRFRLSAPVLPDIVCTPICVCVICARTCVHVCIDSEWFSLPLFLGQRDFYWFRKGHRRHWKTAILFRTRISYTFISEWVCVCVWEEGRTWTCSSFISPDRALE